MFETGPDLSRVALYARYSSHLQNPKSIDDQLAECQRHIHNLGGTVVARYSDAAVSGSTALKRPGIQALLRDCRRNAFTAVCAEALDRISRDIEDTAHIQKQLEFSHVTLLTINEGPVGPVIAAFKSTMNAMFLTDLASKTRRGQIALINQGRQIGRPAYGYRIANRIEGSKIIRGLREIDPDTSLIVRRIYRLYLDGSSARAIARTLNEEGIPPPHTARAWNHSSLTGAHSFFGILTNPIYKGSLHYGVIETATDPATAKRVYRPNPKETWRITQVPALQIVDDETWHAVQERIHSRSLPRRHTAGAPSLARGAMPLTTLLRCSRCKGPVRTIGRHRWACNESKARGKCTARTFVLRDIDRLSARQLTSWVRRHKDWNHILQDAHNRIVETRAHLRAELSDCNLRMNRLVQAIETGTDTPQMRDRMMELSDEIHSIEAELNRYAIGSQFQPETINLKPILAEYASNLQASIDCDDPETRIEATIRLADLLDHIDMSAGPTRGKARLRIKPNAIALIRVATRTLANA